ncbi:hypothetical protein H0W32_00885 [Patescibacteria group bacterium]|nr:hypothetical protein [Patescibacteria group bacterium]
MPHDVITWDAPEYHHFEKSTDWYWSLGIITICITIICLLFNNILFAIFILLSGFVTALYGGRSPELIHIELRPRGLVVKDKFYPYTTLDSFWVDEEDHPQKVIFKSKKLLMPYIVVPVSHIHPEDIRMYLRMYLKEVEHHESLGHKVLEYFGF